MREGLKVAGIFALVIGTVIGLSYVFGWMEVHQLSTIGKARQNASRVVFEQSQSYVEGKRQEAAKLYLEHERADSPTAKAAIRATVAQSFANFDENLLHGPVAVFVHGCKYGGQAHTIF